MSAAPPGEMVGVVVLVACETDFVARSQEFREFIDTLAKVALVSGADNVESLLNAPVIVENL